MNIVIKRAVRAKKGSPRKTKLLRLMTIATQFFMDRQVVASPKKLSTGTKETLEAQLPDLKKAGLDMKLLKREWKGNALNKKLSAPAAAALNKLLK